jgi:hypothetical protein
MVVEPMIDAEWDNNEETIRSLWLKQIDRCNALYEMMTKRGGHVLFIPNRLSRREMHVNVKHYAYMKEMRKRFRKQWLMILKAKKNYEAAGGTY